MNSDWLSREELSGMDPRKKAKLIEFLEKVQSTPQKKLMPVFLRFQQEMQAENLLFTKDEAQLMIRLLKETMNDQEKKRLQEILKQGETQGKRPKK